VKLYRTIKIDPADGLPLVGIRRDMLGVRPFDPNNKDPKRVFDVDAVADSDLVRVGTKKGLSVFLTAEECRVDPKAPIWEIDSDEVVAQNLVMVFDPLPGVPGSTHHVLEPSRDVTLGEYQEMLRATRDAWQRVP
jgi:hypothetical protein